MGPNSAPSVAYTSSTIAIFTSEFPPYPGGIATYTYEFAAAARRLGHYPIVFAPKLSATEREITSTFQTSRIRPARYHHLYVPWMAAQSVRTLLRIRPNIVIAADFPNVLALSPIPMPCRKLAIVHGTDVKSRLIRYINKYTPVRPFNAFDSVYANSLFTKRVMLAHNPSVSADNIIVAPLGVASFWSEKIDAGALPLLLKRFPLLPDRLILLSVGRIEPRKGIAQSIEAIARLPEEIRRRITYLIVGRTIEVDYAHQLMEQISKHDMDIRMIGEVTKEELRGLYHTASLLLHTATRDQFRAEGFGLVLLEAAACGLPAVATKVDAIPEVIRDGVSGVLVDDRDIDAMSNVIGTLLSSKEALPALAVGCKTYSTHFTWDNYARTLLENARPLLRPSSGVDLPHD